mmetsp:Transcript_8248/g.11907  ORF Transcript_8248/g.11907 Transcript_8248/m.11907 type:complete len:116 (+) Transcript_8248:49-396(+)
MTCTNGQNHNNTKRSVQSTTVKEEKVLVKMKEYQLKKSRPGCTGMFWRSDPTGKTSLASNNDWPRDGATMKGEVIEHNGSKWLAVSEVKQKSGDWVAAPTGAFMPFEYDNHYYLE